MSACNVVSEGEFLTFVLLIFAPLLDKVAAKVADLQSCKAD